MPTKLTQPATYEIGSACLQVVGPSAALLARARALEIAVVLPGSVERFLDPRNVADPWTTQVNWFVPDGTTFADGQLRIQISYGVTYHLRANQPYRLLLRDGGSAEIEERFTGVGNILRPSVPPIGWAPRESPQASSSVPSSGPVAQASKEPAARPSAEDRAAPPRPTMPSSLHIASGSTPAQPAAIAALELRVPDIGDFADVEVVELLVKPGDTIEEEQSLITVESEKATMEIPSAVAGTVRELRVKLGDRVSQGSLVVLLEPRPAAAPADTAMGTRSFCTQCSTRLNSQASFCVVCGTKVPDTEPRSAASTPRPTRLISAVPIVAQQAQPPQASVLVRAFCTHCGTGLKPLAAFCVECGWRVGA